MTFNINKEKFQEILNDEAYEEMIEVIQGLIANLQTDFQICSFLLEQEAIELKDKPKVRAIIRLLRKRAAEAVISKEEKNRDSVAFWENIIRNPDSTIKEKRLARTNLDRLINQDNVENPEDPESYAVKIRQLINNGLACTGASRFHFNDDGLFDPITDSVGNMLPCPTQDDKDKRDKARSDAWLTKQKTKNITEED